MKVNVPITKDAINVFLHHIDEVLTLDKCLELNTSTKRMKYFEEQVEFLFPDEMDKWDYEFLGIIFDETMKIKKKGGDI